MKQIAFVILAAMLVGCVATGTQVREDQLAKLEKGKTRIQDVVSTFGQPSSSTLNSDGSRIIVYMYVEAQARPETFIPFIGGLVGGADSRSNMVTLKFDRTGVLVDYSSSTTAMGTGYGASSGTTFDRVEEQPKQSK